MGLKDVWAGVIEYLRAGTMNNVALIRAPAGMDEQYLNSCLCQLGLKEHVEGSQGSIYDTENPVHLPER